MDGYLHRPGPDVLQVGQWGMIWIVGRSDEGIFIEEAEGDPPLEYARFATERGAVRYAIMCEEDAMEPLRKNLARLRRRLKKLERMP